MVEEQQRTARRDLPGDIQLQAMGSVSICAQSFSPPSWQPQTLMSTQLLLEGHSAHVHVTSREGEHHPPHTLERGFKGHSPPRIAKHRPPAGSIGTSEFARCLLGGGFAPRVRCRHPERSHTDILDALSPPPAFVVRDAALTKANVPLGQYRLLFISADLIRSARLGYKALIYRST